MITSEQEKQLRNMSHYEAVCTVMALEGLRNQEAAQTVVATCELFSKKPVSKTFTCPSPFTGAPDLQIQLTEAMVDRLKTLPIINAIKTVRELSGLGLKESKDLVEHNGLCDKALYSWSTKPAVPFVKTTHHTVLHALVYNLECTLATYEHFCSIKKTSKRELDRHEKLVSNILLQDIFDDCITTNAAVNPTLHGYGSCPRMTEILGYKVKHGDNAHEALARYFNKVRYPNVAAETAAHEASAK